MQNKDITEVLLPLLNSGRFTLHVHLAEAFQLWRPRICKPWQRSFQSCSFGDKLRIPKLQIVTTLHKHECSELVISLCYEVMLQFQSWLMNAFASTKTHASIQRFSHFEIPNKYQYLIGISILIRMGRFYDIYHSLYWLLVPIIPPRFMLVQHWLGSKDLSHS